MASDFLLKFIVLVFLEVACRHRSADSGDLVPSWCGNVAVLTPFWCLFAAASNAAPTVGVSQSAPPEEETVNIVLKTIGSREIAHVEYNVAVDNECIQVPETSLPIELYLNASEADFYDIVTFESPDCNCMIDKLEGTPNTILNDRHPICSFQLYLKENSSLTEGNVIVTLHMKGIIYSKTFSSTLAEHVHDICNVHSGQFRFAEKVTVYSENLEVLGIKMFRESSSLPLLQQRLYINAQNETNLAHKTLKNTKLVRSIKIVQNHGFK